MVRGALDLQARLDQLERSSTRRRSLSHTTRFNVFSLASSFRSVEANSPLPRNCCVHPVASENLLLWLSWQPQRFDETCDSSRDHLFVQGRVQGAVAMSPKKTLQFCTAGANLVYFQVNNRPSPFFELQPAPVQTLDPPLFVTVKLRHYWVYSSLQWKKTRNWPFVGRQVDTCTYLYRRKYFCVTRYQNTRTARKTLHRCCPATLFAL